MDEQRYHPLNDAINRMKKKFDRQQNNVFTTSNESSVHMTLIFDEMCGNRGVVLTSSGRTFASPSGGRLF